MTLQGVLPADAAARSLFASYPPALPLWQYLAQTVNGLLGGGFDEGLLFTSYQCLMLAFFMPFLRGARLRRPLEWLALAAGVPLCVLAAFPRGLDLLHADMMVGVLGGFACAWPLLFSVRDRFSLLTLCASLAVLTLCKDAGLLYALAGAAAAYACLRTQGSEPGSCKRKCGPARVVAACLRGGGAPHMERICNGHGRGGAGHLLRSGQFERVALAGGRMAAYHTAQFSLQIF